MPWVTLQWNVRVFGFLALCCSGCNGIASWGVVFEVAVGGRDFLNDLKDGSARTISNSMNSPKHAIQSERVLRRAPKLFSFWFEIGVL